MFKRLSTPIVALSIFLLGALLAEVLDNQRHIKCRISHPLINAEVVCDKPAVIKKTGYASTQGKIERFIESEKALGNITEAAIYFRDLSNGPVFGINETMDFAPASLLKLPLALVYLGEAEENQAVLSEQLSVEKPQWNFAVHFPQTEGNINPKEPHTVDNLLFHMLAYSDNDAYGVLQTHLYEIGRQDLITTRFLDFGLIDPNDITDEIVSVRRYAGIFRALYNISYLNTSLSEKILGWLSQSDFRQGLQAGVPANIAVAHKFGERFIDTTHKQLHDCGIIYYPDNPYLLCVMTKGMDFENLVRVIQHISKEIYTEVNSRRI